MVEKRPFGGRTARGFTVVELLFTLMFLGLVLVISVPRAADARRTLDVNRAVRTVALDLEQALSLSARQRTPVRITQPASTLQLVIEDVQSGNVFHTRNFADGSEATLDAMTLDPATVTVFPTGRVSGQLTVTIESGDLSRTLTMSQAGRVVAAP